MRTASKIAAPLSIAAYFLILAGEGLRAYFSPDDLMNLYICWLKSPAEILKANVLFFSTFFRPMGAVFYRILYAAFGFHPAPFHIACFAILLSNLYLCYCLVRRLTENREVALLAVLISAYHARFVDLYYNAGTVYDLLCFTFFYGAFLYYIRIRQSGDRLNRTQAAVCCLLYICALNSKEMAVSFPIFIAAYEWFYHRSVSRRTVQVLALITLVFIVGKTIGRDSMTVNPAYHPQVSVRNYFDAFQTYAGKLFYAEQWFDIRKSVLLLTLMLAVAWISKSRQLKLSFVFITAGILPVAFITLRGGFILYMPMVGWAIFGATILVRARDAVLPSPKFGQALLFTVTMLGLGRIHHSHHEANWLPSPNDKLQLTVESMWRLQPNLPKGAKVLFLNDPFERDENWQLMGLLQLAYADRNLEVQTQKRLNSPPNSAELDTFGYIFDFMGSGFVQIKPPTTSSGRQLNLPDLSHPANF